MQNLVLHKKLYQINKIDESEYSQKVYERYEKLRLYQRLRAEGCSEKTALEAIGMSRSKLFRLKGRYKSIGLVGLEDRSKRPHRVRQPLWDMRIEKTVLETRRKYPLWGKYKLAMAIKKDSGEIISSSTIGRILKKAMRRGVIKPVSFLFGENERKQSSPDCCVILLRD